MLWFLLWLFKFIVAYLFSKGNSEVFVAIVVLFFSRKEHNRKNKSITILGSQVTFFPQVFQICFHRTPIYIFDLFFCSMLILLLLSIEIALYTMVSHNYAICEFMWFSPRKPLFLNLRLILSFYLKGWVTKKGGETERNRIFPLWFNTQMTAKARTKPGQCQELGASLRSPLWHRGQMLGSPSTAFPDALAGCWIRSGTAWAWIDTHMVC